MFRRFALILSVVFVAGTIAAAGETSQEAQLAAVAAQERTVRVIQRASVARQMNRTADESSFFDLPTFAPAPPSTVAGCEPISLLQLNSIVERAARRESVPASLVRAVIQQESGGSVCAVSPKGAQGLMQLMPGTASDLQVTDAMDAEQNVSAGTKLLGQLMREYHGDLNRVLAAYNAGRKRVEEAGGVPDLPETIHYVSAILSHLGFLNQK